MLFVTVGAVYFGVDFELPPKYKTEPVPTKTSSTTTKRPDKTIFALDLEEGWTGGTCG
jgi:hypothetical protein